MAFDRIEEVFLRLNAGRHFVALTYRLRRGNEATDGHVSCFVVELANVWFLLTAGHVIKGENGLERAAAEGYRLDKVQIVDAFAGRSTTPLPITFELAEWVAIDNDELGLDFAALPLKQFFCEGLAAVGVSPIESHAIGQAEFHDDSQLVIVGVPTESFKLKGNDGTMKLLLVPLTEYGGSDFPVKGDTVLATMGENPAEEAHRVNDIAGMSGCPVFRIVNKAGQQKKYWAVGVQSGWYASHRVVRFCPIDRFVAALEDGVRQYQERHGREPGSCAGS